MLHAYRTRHYPALLQAGQQGKQVEFADVGCGFGGLLVRLSPLYPDKLMLGMELRDKVLGPVCCHICLTI